MEVLRFTLANEFGGNDGNAVGQLVGLVDTDDDVTWRDLLAVKKIPAKLLPIEAEISDYYDAAETVYGSFWPPRESSLLLTVRFGAKSPWLLDICHMGKSVGRMFFIFPRKEGVRNDKGREAMRFSEQFPIYSYRDAAIALWNFKVSTHQKTAPSKNEHDDAREAHVGKSQIDLLRKDGSAI